MVFGEDAVNNDLYVARKVALFGELRMRKCHPARSQQCSAPGEEQAARILGFADKDIL